MAAVEDRPDGRPADLGARGIEPTDAQAPSSDRIELIDALRGFALLGILLVNIQSFAWGAGEPLGYFATPPSRGEQALVFALAALVAGKFYAIFAFLFGVGFTLQTRRMLALVGGSRHAATRLYLRRLTFLFVAGLVHGIFLYFGDILATYAICALALLPFAFARTRVLVRAIRIAWILVLVLLSFWTVLYIVTGDPGSGGLPPDILAAREIYTGTSYLDQVSQRFGDDMIQLVGGAALSWPQVVALMLTGALAGRLRWFRDPARHPVLWRRAMRLGLWVGLPCALAGAWLHLETMKTDPDSQFGAGDCLMALSGMLSCAYFATAVNWRVDSGRGAALGRAVLRWLAPAGRMPLTLYITQSIAMNLLLAGWGLGLGDKASRGELTLLAFAIYALQIVAARLLARRFRSGPLEWLWRRYTYRGLALVRSSTMPASSTFNQSPR
jgi:uncharacterized protein